MVSLPQSSHLYKKRKNEKQKNLCTAKEGSESEVSTKLGGRGTHPWAQGTFRLPRRPFEYALFLDWRNSEAMCIFESIWKWAALAAEGYTYLGCLFMMPNWTWRVIAPLCLGLRLPSLDRQFQSQVPEACAIFGITLQRINWFTRSSGHNISWQTHILQITDRM